MVYVFFENDDLSKTLHPLNYFRSNIELRVGGYTLLEKWQFYLTMENYLILTRDFLQDYTDEVHQQDWPQNNGDYILINSQAVPTDTLIEKISSLKKGEGLVSGTQVVALYTDSIERDTGTVDRLASGMSLMQTEVEWIQFPWDLVEKNKAEISRDIALFKSLSAENSADFNHVHIINPENVHIAEGASIYPNVVLNGENGPIVVSKKSKIYPFSYVEGPVFIGENALLKPGTRLLGGSTVGPNCKVAGEISSSIFHSFANKQHDGFLGNSYLSPWVNLGADTNNSNLKNNYLNVRVPINGTEIDTGLLFAGLFAGDHAKSAINTMFNTGTVMGCFSNVYGAGFPDKFIPNFAWGSKNPFMIYHLNKAIKTARTVKARRQQQISEIEETLIREVFAMTAKEGRKDA